uniref:Uncharacterized protein n=1 Tax=Dulem virus 40 TaxID=3145758 RepID=A0AAU8AX00_9CAUD
MNKFERVLLNFGPLVLSTCFHIAVSTERYEDCAEMKRIAERYDIDLGTSIEDWQMEFWKRGLSGETAISNAPVYLAEALGQIGYLRLS